MIWLLPLLPALGGLVVFLSGFRARSVLAASACGLTAVTLLSAALAAAGGWSGRVEWSEALNLTAALPPASAVMAMLVPTIALPVLLFAAYHEEKRGLSRLMALLLLFVAGMELLVIAADFLTLLIGWEIVGACSWALIGHEWRKKEAPSSGRYAFVATRLGDLGLFLAAMSVYAAAASFSFDSIALMRSPHVEILAFGVLLAASAKSGQVPFSPWLFRAMQGPTSVSALLHAATMVAAGAFLLIRLHPYLAEVPGFGAAAIGVGLVTALCGGIVAVLQLHAKKLLAASTSAQYGLMFVAVGAGYPGAALAHLVAHAGFKALLFLSAGVAGKRAHSYLLQLMGFGRALPLVAALTATGTLALAGVPPLGGAWTKELVVAAAEHANLWVAAGAMFSGALSAAYAARFQLLAFGPTAGSKGSDLSSRAEITALSLLSAFTLVLCLLWLPDARSALSALLGMKLPQIRPAGMTASLILVAIGLLAGAGLGRQWPSLGMTGPAARQSNWLGLPVLIEAAIVRPFNGLAHAAARFDDAVVDAGPRGIVRAAGFGSNGLRRADEWTIERVVRHSVAGLSAWLVHADEWTIESAVRHSAARLSAWLVHADERIVDRCVGLLAAATGEICRAGDKIGEFLTDGLPEGTAQLVGLGGEDARRLQTGLSHHYYTLMAAGTLVTVLILLMV